MSQFLVSLEVYERLRQTMAADPSGFRELYRDYLSDAQQTIRALQSAWRSRNHEEFCFRAHYLKGSSLVLGISSVAQCCVEMEQGCRSAQPETAFHKLAEVSDLLRLVQDELLARLGPEVLPVAA